MKQYQNKNWLHQKYSVEKLSMQKIGNLCGYDASVICRWLKKFNIKTRNYSEAVLGIKKPRNIFLAKKTFQNKDWLLRKYKNENMTTRQIAKLCDVSKHTITIWLKKYGILLRPVGGGRGEKNPLWKGGDKAYMERRRRTNEYKKYQKQWLKDHPNYTTNRSRKMKIVAIEYKGGKCQKCNILYDGRNACIFDFHHKDLKIKEKPIGALINRSWERIKSELDKTDLTCSNCHRLIHNGGK